MDFNKANRCVNKLKKHLSGEIYLDERTIEACRALIITACSESFYFFAKAVLGFKLLTPQTHKRWADDVQAKFLSIDRFMRLKPRGTYKTTLFGEAFPLWVWAVYSRDIKFMYTSASNTLVSNVSTHIRGILKEGLLYSFIFNIHLDKKQKNTENEINLNGTTASKEPSLTFKTAGSGTAGLHPNIIIVDDPCDFDDRTSEAVRRKKKVWYDSLKPLMVDFEYNDDISIKKILYIATMWHIEDLTNYIIEKNEKVHPDDRFDIAIEGLHKEDGSIRYPEMYSKEDIRSIKSDITDVFYFCQYENKATPEGDLCFIPNQLHFFNPKTLNFERGTNFCFFDPSRGKKNSDYPAAIWINLYNGVKHLFDNIDNKLRLDAILKEIALKNKEYNVRTFVFESNNIDTLEKNIAKIHKEINYSCYIVPIHETRNKIERITAMQPDLYNGSFLFRSDHEFHYPELMRQLVNFPLVKNDDFPDVIEKAITYLIQFSDKPIKNYKTKSVITQKDNVFSLKTKKVKW